MSSIKFISVILLFSLLYISSCSDNIDVPNKNTYSDLLEYGSYDVGFRTINSTDITRNGIPYSDWSGKLYPTDENTLGRNIPLHIWYPAMASENKLDYDYFVKLITRDSENKPSKSLDSLAFQMFISQTNDLGGGGNFDIDDLDSLMSLRTISTLESRAVEDKFPLVVFPNGSSPAYQSIMSELLASHGFVVAGLSLKGEYAHTLDASVRGLEVGIDDLQFGLQHLLALDNVDNNQIALIGNAIESSICAGYISRNQKIKALISLEGGLLSQFEQDILDQTIFYEPQDIQVPILAIYAPHPAISPHYIYDLKYSNRYFAHFPGMSEFHFLNFGIFEEFVSGIIGETKGNTVKGFREASNLILTFLNASLKNQHEDFENHYLIDGNNTDDRIIDTFFIHEGLNAPPNIATIKNMFITDGMSSLDSLYQLHKSLGDEQPFAQSFYTDLRNWLAWKKDPDYVFRKQLYTLAVDSYPSSALSSYYLAYYMDKSGDTINAKKQYSKALELLKTDIDIDDEMRSSMVETIGKSLN